MVTCSTTVGLTAGHEEASLRYVIEADRNAPLTIDEREFAAVRWFAFDQIPYARADPALANFIAKLRALKTVPQSGL